MTRPASLLGPVWVVVYIRIVGVMLIARVVVRVVVRIVRVVWMRIRIGDGVVPGSAPAVSMPYWPSPVLVSELIS